jgi:1,2-phenylacetyl-CoA epoxidase PaaB subunit
MQQKSRRKFFATFAIFVRSNNGKSHKKVVYLYVINDKKTKNIIYEI